MMETVTVNASALRQVLEAFLGPAYLIGELRVIHDLHQKFPQGKEEVADPVGILVREYNAAAEAYNSILKAKQEGTK
jgi:hypothetical protein